MASGTFVTAINCMDGRVQLPVINYLKDKYSVDYVDMVTEPGPIKIVADNHPAVLAESIKLRVGISVDKHGSKVVAFVGHDDCAGNPVDRETQENQIHQCLEIAKGWDFDVEYIGLYVTDKWEVEPVL